MPLLKPQREQAISSIHPTCPTKSILKPSPAQTPIRVASPSPDLAAVAAPGGGPGGAKHAHFPPPGQEPTARYSGLDYDRTPIVVLPNICALPERGCPGKTYFHDDRSIGAGLSSSAQTPSAAHSATRAANHAHPAKLLKKPPPSSPPPLPLPLLVTTVPGSVPPALTHSDTPSSDDYDSDETYPHPPVFPLSEPAASVFSTSERERKTSGASEVTVVPVSRYAHGRNSIGIGRRAWKPTNESSEDDCLSGF